MIDYSIREATVNDVEQIMFVRFAVKENVLSNPELVSNADCIEYLTERGRGWVATYLGKVVGFAIVDLRDDNVWALFVLPEEAKRGIGKRLHDRMLNWYFDQGKERVWLSTDPGTRAEGFYRQQGWTDVGCRPNGEVKFELTRTSWLTQ